MARRAEESENHWPGFVDALSTIVMVVTFLLIILGIVIFVISKNISTELAKSAHQVKEAQAALDDALKKAESHRRKAHAAQQAMAAMSAGKDRRKQTAAASRKQMDAGRDTAQKMQASAAAKKSASSFKLQTAKPLTQNDRVESPDNHTVRSRQTKTREIEVVSVEKETDPRKIKVKSSTALLSLIFRGGVQISGEAQKQVSGFLKTHANAGEKAQYEVRAFYTTHKGSISEARRLAYYRALASRNQLLAEGVKGEQISIRITMSSRPDDAGRVNIYLK